MGQPERTRVAGFELALDRRYHPSTHMWALALGPDRVRVGMDASGPRPAAPWLSFRLSPSGPSSPPGQPFGQLEAAKFVGPLVSPVSGAVLAVE